jgi:hypothetical protein
MFSSNTTQTSGGSDPQFNYVTMLLHGDGTNGGQNNTFLDASTNNLTITRTGNPTQGSFSPYGPNWANYFDGSSYLNTGADSNNLASGDFTIESWVFHDSAISDYKLFFSIAPNTCYFGPKGSTSYCLNLSGAEITWSTTIPINTWYHVAAVRSGTTITLYINGTSVGTNTNSDVLGGTSDGNIRIGSAAGYGLNGYLSSLRYTKAAVYTSAFTPSTTPLASISGTRLLTCQSNRFLDNSSFAQAFTITGTPSVQRFNPFGAATAYLTSAIGGSGYFDGAGDNLTFPSNSGLLGSNDFSFEAWVYPIALPSIAVISMGQSDLGSAAGSSYGFYVSPSGDASDLYVGTANYSVTSPNPRVRAWNHVAWVRTSGTFSAYLNGVRVGTSSVAGSINNGDTAFPASLGGFSNGPVGRPFNGYIAGYRRIIGSGGYNAASSTITIPTAPPTAVTNTNALLNFTNAAIFDNAMMNDLETVGNAQISTSVKKFGTGSISLDGTGDYLDPGGSTVNFVFGTGDFTIEFWMYLNSTTQGHPIDFRPSSVNGAYPTLYITSNTLIYFVDSSNRITSSSLSTSTWYHVAISRSGTSTKMFINGTQNGSTYTDSTNYLCKANGPRIGANDGGTGGVNGYIDDLRITKGFARYTTNFTPPTAAFSDTGPI